MQALNLKWLRWGLVLTIVACLMAVQLPTTPAALAQTPPPKVGIACTTGTSPNPTFTLTAKTGYINLPDGNTAFMWGYAPGSGGFQHPGPVLCVNQGDTVTVILNNTLGDDVSIVFPGQEGVLANGAPAQPQFNGPTLTSLTNVAPSQRRQRDIQLCRRQPGHLYL